MTTSGGTDGGLRILEVREVRPEATCELNPAKALRAVLDVTRLLGRGRRPSELAMAVLDEVLRLYAQADAGLLAVFDRPDDETALSVLAARRRRGREAGRVPEPSLVRRVARSRHAVIARGERGCSMCVPLIAGDGHVLGVLQLDAEAPGGEFTTRCLDLMLGLVSAVAVAIENARLHERLLRQERWRRDLENARRMQEALLPAAPPRTENHDFFVHYRAARSVGGDFYDFVEFGDGAIGLVVADVTGKGMAAALAMARASLEMRTAMLAHRDPGRVLEAAGEALWRHGLGDRYVTAVVVLLDPREHAARLANAGHPAPLLRLPDGKVAEVEGKGVPLGVSRDSRLAPPEVAVPFAPGACLAMFSDGLVERRRLRVERDGRARLRALLAGEDGSAGAVGARIVAELVADDAELEDDTTLVCVGRSVQFLKQAKPRPQETENSPKHRRTWVQSKKAQHQGGRFG